MNEFLIYFFLAESDGDDDEEKVKKMKGGIKNDNVNNINFQSGLAKDFTNIKRKRTAEDNKDTSTSNYFLFTYSIEDGITDLMKRIINYLLFVSKNVDNKFNWDSNKELTLKVMDYLKDLKMNNPIEFLKVLTNKYYNTINIIPSL